jgi:DNA-binding NarL/FixJ family response regulator
MDLRVLLIHGDRRSDSQYATSFCAAEPAISVSIAQTPQEVRNQPIPGIILLDLELSHPPSLDMLLWLRSEDPYTRIPVIAITSPRTAHHVNRAYELGANSCVMQDESGGLVDEIARGIGSYARVLQSYAQAGDPARRPAPVRDNLT